MAFAVVDGDGLVPGKDVLSAIWEHYEAAKFLYTAKLERLAAALGLIRLGWPQLLKAPGDLFQFHATVRDGRIASSICAYRDTTETYVVQHASSSGHPGDMLKCIIACLTAINADPSFAFARMYFRPENRWPTRAARAIAEQIGPARSVFATQEYLHCQPARVVLHLTQDIVRDATPEQHPAIKALAEEAIGPLRTAALGLDNDDLTLQSLHQRFLALGLRRTRRVLVVEQHGAIAGVALCHTTAAPMNFSYLCSRAEILVHPRAADRAQIVQTLASACIAEAAARGDPSTVLLIDAGDAPAAMQAGYQPTQKQYTSFLWSRENGQGAPSAITGVENLYNLRAVRHVGASHAHELE